MVALILVDIQNDFLPGGQLGVKNGDKVVAVANKLQAYFDFVVATKDWHPANHKSFATMHPEKQEGDQVMLGGLPQVLWPPHCVNDTMGAEFAPALETHKIKKIFYKGVDPDIDSYSGFYDNGHKRVTGLKDYLISNQVDTVYIVGLAADYCVKFTALDAIAEGFETIVVSDGTYAVNLKETDGEMAIQEMRSKGVKILNSKEVTRAP